MRAPVLALSLSALFLPAALGAQDAIGQAVYLEGDVSVVRNGDALAPDSVVIGLAIENYDLMKTGDDGSAQVKISSSRAPASTIVVSPDTQFTFELSTLNGKQRSSVGLISGSLSLKVSKLSSSQDLEVQTENSVLGVRGTDFTVTTSIAGDTLVTCDEGAVACTAANGSEYSAMPGTVVENQAAGTFRQIPVAAGDLEGFRRTWAQNRLAFAQENAPALIRLNAARYMELRAAFDRDYAQLEGQRSIIEKWRLEDRGGRIGAAGEIEREKRAVAGAMIRLRRTQFLMERVHARLLRLKVLHDQGYGRGALTGAMTTTQFFDQLQRDRRDVEHRMATVRYVRRLYLRRNNDVDLREAPEQAQPPRPERPQRSERPLRERPQR